MGKLKLQLKVYIDKYGNQYLEGAKNQLFPLYKLSNNVYELNVISENEYPTAKVSFEKADGSITTQFSMALTGYESVDGNTWVNYQILIENSVLDISEKTANNMLGFSFNFSDEDSTLNTDTIYVKCSYSINGTLPQLSASDFDIVMASIATTFKGRDVNKVFHYPEPPEIVDFENDPRFEKGYVYIVDGMVTEIYSVPEPLISGVLYKWIGTNGYYDGFYFKNQDYYYYDKETSSFANYWNYENKIGIAYIINENWHAVELGIISSMIFDIKDLRSQTNTNKSDITNIKNKQEEHSTQIVSLETQQTTNTRDISNIKNEQEEHSTKINALETQQATNTDNITQLKQDIKKFDTVEENLNDYKEENNTINNNQSQSISDLQSDLAGYKTTNNEKITGIENTINEINNSKLPSYSSRILQNEFDIDSLDGKTDTLSETKLNKNFTDINSIDFLGDTDYFVINRSGTSYKVNVSVLKRLFGSTDTEQVIEHYKGNYSSLEELNKIVGSSGDYGFVYTRISETDTTFVMYIWNSQDNAWEETSTSQYVLSVDYEEYRDQILNGGITVKRAKDYDENDGTIKAKFNELINIITNINSVKVIDGPTLEDMEYEEGRLYYVNQSSDSFTKNTMYYGKENGGIMMINASEVSLEPAIVTFTMVGANSVEVGNTTKFTKYTMTLKKYAQFSKIKITSGSDTIVDNITPNPSISSTINYTIKNTSIGLKTITATGTLTSGGTKTKNLNYQVYGRQYYGGSTNETLTSQSGTASFGKILESTDNVKTFLQQNRVSSLSISLGNTPTYLYFVIPSNMTINSIVSGPLSFPFIQQDNINITNYYNASVACKVYRSANKVYGDINLTIS